MVSSGVVSSQCHDTGKPSSRFNFSIFWAWVWPISGLTGSKFGLFSGVQMGSKFSFGEQNLGLSEYKF